MRFKVFIINDLGNVYEENFIANNEELAKRNVLVLNPNSFVL